ncbi:MAG: alpha/beta hydrolase [Pseudomonadota bacterium]
MTENTPENALTESAPQFLNLNDNRRLAYHRHQAGAARGTKPGVVFMGGFRSDMTGSKATHFEQLCREMGTDYLRFDYTGHGDSSGEFADGSIGEWSQDAIDALDHLTTGPQILIGSSMGGWIMLNVAVARPDRLHALVGIAAAPDFTEELMWASMTAQDRETLMRDGRIEQPNDYSDEPYLITKKLIEEGRDHRRLTQALPITCPIRLIHGIRDTDVPYGLSERLAHHLDSDDVELILIKNGDHRLSDAHPLTLTSQVIQTLLAGS